MATLHVVLTTPAPKVIAPVSSSVVLAADTVTTSGSSAQSSLTAQGVFGQLWSVTVTGGNVFIAFGANPTAASDSGWLLIDGTTREFLVGSTGDKIAVINA